VIEQNDGDYRKKSQTSPDIKQYVLVLQNARHCLANQQNKNPDTVWKIELVILQMAKTNTTRTSSRTVAAMSPFSFIPFLNRKKAHRPLAS